MIRWPTIRSADAKYAATTIVSTSVAANARRACLGRVAKAPYVSRSCDSASVRLLDPIAAFAINLNAHADAADTSNNDGTGMERNALRDCTR
jgi:hypothetical protein